MEIDIEELKREYSEMSDEGLLAFDRKDLTEVARPYYDAEIAQRGLHPEAADEPQAHPEPNPEEDLVTVETYLSIYEADLGRTLLQSADIPAFLDNELSSGMTGAGGLRLMVPAKFAKQAEEILEAPISDEDLAAQAEAADHVDADLDDREEGDQEKISRIGTALFYQLPGPFDLSGFKASAGRRMRNRWAIPCVSLKR